MPTDNTTTVIARDGTVTTYQGGGNDQFDVASFFAGLFVAALIYALTKFRAKRGEARLKALHADAGGKDFESEYKALAQRTATLERIVTEPAARVDREIEALR